MGAPIARRLAAAGHAVRAWNRAPEKAEGLGATVAGEPAEAVEGAGVVITMLADGATVEAVMPPLPPEVLWAQMSTVGVEDTARFAASHARYLDAPVLGSIPEAERGELVVFAAGPREPEGLFDPLAQRVLRLDDEPGAATRLKLVVNLWLLDLVESVAETFALAEALGLDPRAFLDAISGMPVDSPYAHLKGAKMLSNDYSANFPLRLALKDARLALAAAAAAGVELPVGKATEERLTAALELGHGDKDTAAVYLTTADEQP
jgi:3-hydroxyisobutyrate dehydrogenase